jgi:NADH dehydrogenase
MSLPTVTILGSGFGGIYTAKLLLKKGFQVCLVSDQDCFTFTPLLHQVAVGTLLPYNIGLDNKNFLKNKNLTIIKNKVIKVDFKTKSIILQNNKTLTYDFLVIATGARAKRQTQTTEQIFYLKNLTDALAIKEKLKALIDLKKPITLNVIGAGFTGLEIIFEINSFLKNNSPDLFTLNLFSQNGLPLAKDDKLLGNYLRKKNYSS